MKAPAVILIGGLLAVGQQREGPVFTVTATLVQVDAVVTDSKGRQVTDLTVEDFELIVDGKPQKLTHFAYVQVAPPVQPPPKSVPKSILALAPPPPSPPRPEEVRRTIVLMVDDLGLSFESMGFAHYSLRQFVEKQMHPGDLVAVCRTGAGRGALQQFTSDKRILLSVIDGLRWNPNGRFGLSYAEPQGKYATIPAVGPSGDPQSREVSYDVPSRSEIFTVGTLGAIRYIVGALREMPGRKSIVLFSDGMMLFQPGMGPHMHTGMEPSVGGMQDYNELLEALRKLIDSANRAGTVIYTMHTVGLDTRQLGAQDRVALDQMGADQVLSTMKSLTEVGQPKDILFNAQQQGLAFLALATGGIPHVNGNDLNWGLDRVLEDQRGYYLLGYQPPESTFAGKNRARNFHRIVVKVKRKGLHVRSRSGFFGETDEETRPTYETPLQQMRAAMLSPFRSSGVRLRLTALYSEVPKLGPVVRNLLHIDTRDLTFGSAADGSERAQLSVVAVAVGKEDRRLATVAREYELRVEAGRLEEALKAGAVYTLDVAVRKAGAYQIRVAVRDEATRKVGSASQFIDVPDVKKGRFALASVILQDGERPPAASGFLGLTPARRQFQRGGKLEYVCLVEKGRKKGSDAGLAAQVRIVRDGRDVYSGPAKVAAVNGSTRAVHGLLKLADAITPGEYFRQVVVTDSTRKSAAAERWTDFEVLP